MTKEWVANKNAENKRLLEEAWAKFKEKLRSTWFIDEEDVESIYQATKRDANNKYWIESVNIPEDICNKQKEKHKDKIEFFINKLKMMADRDGYYLGEVGKYNRNFDRYADSEPIEFDGDIIITDPCYIVTDKDHDLDELNYYNMEILGIQNYMSRDTIHGDWSCTVFDMNTKNPIGEFCADAGMVSVFLLDEVLKYNPAFDYHLNRKWTTAWIKDFKGTVQFIVKEETGIYEEDSKWYKKGDTWTEYSVEVEGHGINKITGEPINFVGKQTGF